MSLTQAGLIMDAIGVVLVYFFAFDIPISGGKRAEGVVVTSRLDTPKQNSFLRFYPPQLFSTVDDFYRMLIADLGLCLIVSGFVLQFFGQQT